MRHCAFRSLYLPLFHGLRKKGAMTAMPSAPISAACWAFLKEERPLRFWSQFQCVWVWVFPHTNKQFSNTICASCHSTLLGDGSKFHILWVQSHKTTPSQILDASHKHRLSPVLPTNLLQTECSCDPLLGLINLLGQLTTQRNILLLGHQFIIERYNSELARWKRYTGQCMGKGCRAPVFSPSLSVPLSPNFHVFTDLEAP